MSESSADFSDDYFSDGEVDSNETSSADESNFFAKYLSQQQQQQQQSQRSPTAVSVPTKTTNNLVHFTSVIPTVSGEASLSAKATTTATGTKTNSNSIGQEDDTTFVRIASLSELEKAALASQQNERLATLAAHQQRLASKVKNTTTLAPSLFPPSSSASLATKTVHAAPTKAVTPTPLDTNKFIDVTTMSFAEKQKLSQQCRQMAAVSAKESSTTLKTQSGLLNASKYYSPSSSTKLSCVLPGEQRYIPPTYSAHMHHNCRLMMGRIEDITEKNCTLSAMKKPTTTATTTTPNPLDRLVDINTLSHEKQQAILAKNKPLQSKTLPTSANLSSSTPKTYANKSVVNQKKDFEALNSRNYMNPAINAVYHGLSAPKPGDEKGSTDTEDEKKKKGAMITVDASAKTRPTMEQLAALVKKRYPHFYELMKETGARDMMKQLLEKTQLNFLLIVPSKRLLVRYRNMGMGYYVLMLDIHAEIPADTALYSVATFMQRLRRFVRRVDDSMLIVDNWARAVLDKDSNGRIYVIEDDGEEPVPDKIDFQQQQVVEDLPALPSNEPQIIERVPAEGDEILQPMAVDEDVIRADEEREIDLESVDSYLIAVHRNTHYKVERRVEQLGKKMLEPNYKGPVSMASFIDHSKTPLGANASAGSVSAKQQQQPTQQKTKLFLKLYSYENLFKRYQSGPLGEREHLTLTGEYVIEGQHNYTIAKNAVALTEYELAAHTPIPRSAFVDHLAVVSFETTPGQKDTAYRMTSFMLPDDKAASNVYMSSKENVFLGFSKNNTLQSIVVNHASPHFLSCPACMHGNYDEDDDDEVEGKPREKRHRPWIVDSVMHPLSCETYACACFDESAHKKLYARDLPFEQFIKMALPLSAPSILDRLRSGATSAFKQTRPLTLLKKVPLKLSKYEKFREATSKAIIGYGDNAYRIASNTATFRFQKRHFKKQDDPSNYLIEYRAKKDADLFQFSSLAGKEGVSLTMNITLDDLFDKGQRSVLFKLADTSLLQAAASGKNKGKYFATDDKDHVWLSSESPTVTYYFRLTSDLGLQAIYLKFVSEKNEKYLRAEVPLDAVTPAKTAVATNNNTSAPTVKSVPTSAKPSSPQAIRPKSTTSNFLKQFAAFISREAALTLELDVNNATAVEYRMGVFVPQWRQRYEAKCDIGAVFTFFMQVRNAIQQYATNSGFVMDMKMAPQLSEDLLQRISKSGYITPDEEVTQNFITVMSSQFYCTQHDVMVSMNGDFSDEEMAELVKAIVAQYLNLFKKKAVKTNTEFVQYCRRVILIADLCEKTLKKTKI